MRSKNDRALRADHCGSFIRPAVLRQARKDHYFGRLGFEELRAVEDKAIREVIALQRGAGIEIVTDGEFRRRFWFSGLYESLEGYSESRAPQCSRA